MGKTARPSTGLPSPRLRPRFRGQRWFRVASVRESIHSECPVLRPCTPPVFRYRCPVLRPNPFDPHCCLRSFSSTPTPRGRCYGGTRFPGDQLSPHLPHCVAEADAQDGLTGILEDVYDLTCRSFEKEMLTIGQQVNVRVAADDF